MSSKQTKWGLVLSGGGARGAYQVGLVRALAQFGFEPAVVSGASIGALNGAVVASSNSLAEAVIKLEDIWLGLDQDKVIKGDNLIARYIALAILHLIIYNQLDNAIKSFSQKNLIARQVEKLLGEESVTYFRLLDSSPLEDILKQYLDFDKLCGVSARDLYISVFPSTEGRGIVHFDDILQDLWHYIRSSKQSVYLKLQEYPVDEAIKILMASAALPLAFKPIKVRDKYYRDGGMGDNTPIQPLITAGCTHAIVSIIGDGVLWNKYDWQGIKVIEIRPSQPLENGNSIQSLLNFNQARIHELVEQGEKDTIKTISRLQSSGVIISEAIDSLNELTKGHESLEEKMKSFRKRVNQLTEYE